MALNTSKCNDLTLRFKGLTVYSIVLWITVALYAKTVIQYKSPHDAGSTHIQDLLFQVIKILLSRSEREGVSTCSSSMNNTYNCTLNLQVFCAV